MAENKDSGLNVFNLSCDAGTKEMLKVAEHAQIETIWDRVKVQTPRCRIGEVGVCCRACAMGPCSFTPKRPVSVCGATVHSIVARNLARAIAVGSAAHSDHGRQVVLVLRDVAAKLNKDYKVNVHVAQTLTNGGVVRKFEVMGAE